MTLSYKDAVSMAQAVETATKDSQKLRCDGEEDNPPPAPAVVPHREETDVHQLTHQKPTRRRTPGRGPPTSPKGSIPARKECHRCGGKHDPARCRFKEYECHYCKKRGHLQSVCRRKKADAAKKTEQTHQVADAPPDGEVEEYYMYTSQQMDQPNR